MQTKSLSPVNVQFIVSTEEGSESSIVHLNFIANRFFFSLAAKFQCEKEYELTDSSVDVFVQSIFWWIVFVEQFPLKSIANQWVMCAGIMRLFKNSPLGHRYKNNHILLCNVWISINTIPLISKWTIPSKWFRNFVQLLWNIAFFTLLSLRSFSACFLGTFNE